MIQFKNTVKGKVGEFMFRMNKRSLFTSMLIVLIFFFFITAKLPYYIYKPGTADELSNMVEVDLGYSSTGEFHLVTVSGGRATPIEYVMAKMSPYHDVLPIEEALPEGFTDEEYRYYQLKMMDDSQTASKVVAYEAADEMVDITLNGVYVVQTIEGMPAEDIVKVGDRIIAVDHIEVNEPSDLITYVEEKSIGDIVRLTLMRNEQVTEVEVKVDYFPENKDKQGIGIQLIADQSVHVEPHVNIKSGNIGGPSAGLMFALEIHNQLVEEDITKGYSIAGTGEIDFEGNVLRVGGVDKKVIAAHRKGVDIFFAPHEQGNPDSNYELAKRTAKEIKTEMEVVPIDSFTEALEYLNQLEPKHIK